MNTIKNVFVPEPHTQSEGISNASFLVLTLILLLTLGLLGFGGYRYFEFKSQAERNAAVDGCMHVSEFRNEDAASGVTTVAPMMDVYQKCMEQKGYSVSI